MTINSIIRWFEITKPEPTTEDISTQIGCHFEEVAEMATELGMYGAEDILTDVADRFKFVKQTCLGIDDNVKFLDALCDQVVTAIGVGVLMGFDMEKALAEVNRSNYTKFNADGTPYIRPDGKIGKNPETYQEPELEPFLPRNKGDQE